MLFLYYLLQRLFLLNYPNIYETLNKKNHKNSLVKEFVNIINIAYLINF